ncbi:hypothetical protein DFJ58DRAFT_719031 [Suillus subalutaceus]|uniref:uncharacterized protein n=1 Tax=Suillus subalutaceus TaxID=48586 RepID=UPI001B865D6D|nr:uncharacterized protein DFJ58DRAFT_719031 [Suillus subalutaceus]KAG1836735.1 hypothetical protein DFJ58DRAFT_719031 [Suillus subalutaceus]
MLQTLVTSVTHSKDRPHAADRALPMFQRVATLVKPIMRKHGWLLPLLSGFSSKNPNLVASVGHISCSLRLLTHSDVNGGEQILLRLRLPWAPDSFYEEDQVVRVMLHEARNSFLHSRTFWLPLARLKALEAAEKRHCANGVFGGGGRLGGRRITALQGMDPRELAAQAAERRNRDEIECGSAERAARESIEDIIDLTDDSLPELWSCLPRPQLMGGQWACAVCTLVNDQQTHQRMCLRGRHRDPSMGWTCITCGEADIPHQFWSCRFCGAIKTESTYG